MGRQALLRLRRLLVRAAVAAAVLRGAGHLARVYRNRELARLTASTLRALAVDVPAEGACRQVTVSASPAVRDGDRLCAGAGGDQFDAFLDWSSLLGVWRGEGVLYDEEDADLGVVVPPGRSADDVAAVLRAHFAADESIAGWPWQLGVEVDEGLVYVVPEYNRLHLDLYLVRHDALGGTVHPLWAPPTRSDSHAAATHPRPVAGICTAHGFPCPADAEAYLRSLYGYLGSDATYNPGTMLYEQRQATATATAAGAASSATAKAGRAAKAAAEAAVAWVASGARLLARDAYFLTIMAPVHESTRRFAESRYEAWVDAGVAAVCGEGRSFRDCFH